MSKYNSELVMENDIWKCYHSGVEFTIHRVTDSEVLLSFMENGKIETSVQSIDEFRKATLNDLIYRDPVHLCPSCGTEYMEGEFTGPYCPNNDCKPSFDICRLTDTIMKLISSQKEVTEADFSDCYGQYFVVFRDEDAYDNDYWIAVSRAVPHHTYLSAIAENPADALYELVGKVIKEVDKIRNEK